jgi:hypothetical protein
MAVILFLRWYYIAGKKGREYLKSIKEGALSKL